MMIDDESPEHSLCGISESEMPMDEGSKCKIWAVEVEIRAPGSEGRSKATQTERDTDERAGAGRLPMSRAASSDFDNGDFVDEGYASCEERGRTGGLSRDDADGDWEWVG